MVVVVDPSALAVWLVVGWLLALPPVASPCEASDACDWSWIINFRKSAVTSDAPSVAGEMSEKDPPSAGAVIETDEPSSYFSVVEVVPSSFFVAEVLAG